MNPDPDHERLLSDVLAEDAPTEFRGALLGETLRLAGRRRRWRQVRRGAAVFALVALAALLAWRMWWPRTPQLPVRTIGTSYDLVLTQPLPAGAKPSTQPLSTEQLVASRATVAVVSTTRGGSFRVINDDELLALVAPRPAALVRFGPNDEQLIFANPEDERGFPLN